ncbi:hypothetical protein M8C21_032639, partial [Ambrosia artemisiifolia]
MSILASRGTSKTIKSYEDSQHPDLLHLPFLDPSYRCTDTTSIPTSSRIKPISYHDPMKRIELLCDGCMRPIMSGPIYMCANEEEDHCNFVLHEWCSQLPTELHNHFGHTQHTLILHSKIPVCEMEINPEGQAFYHCRECMQSMHTACAPSILQYETYTTWGSCFNPE